MEYTANVLPQSVSPLWGARHVRPLVPDMPGQPPLAVVLQAMQEEGGRAKGMFRHLRMDSGFQPIYSLPHSRIVGHEALLRATQADGMAVSPKLALEMARTDAELVFADRLCRAVHLRNYQIQTQPVHDQTWLFLNVSTGVVAQRRDFGSFFTDLLAHAGFPARRVVVEILEGAVPDLGLLADAIAWYQHLGCLVALDDFGAEASNIERIWRTAPDIVKLDRELIASAERSAKARRVLPGIVDLIHEAGSLALIEGVETVSQAALAIDAGADLAQGYHFARPAPNPLREGDGGIRALAVQKEISVARQRSELEPYMAAVRQSAKCLQAQMRLTDACAELLRQPGVDRCYLINEKGVQVGESILPAGQEPAASRFAPLENAAGANWSSRSYHYCAIAQPGEVQVSRPYLSVANSCLCITLSLAIRVSDTLSVLCCDLNWEE
ncbi:EAL domain-containing protein [Leeia oryzae]|uniref:EAL domain-containing protein n=1 Tax=Leeia oryzae TaxID=356662 RepID=UPI0003801546|nr:EAL domain-containing protein [Leeia oryzae]